MRKIFFTATIGLLIFLASLSTEDLRVENVTEIEPLEPPPTVNHWWQTNILIAEGHGSAPESAEVTRLTKTLAKRAAIVDAQRNLAEQVANIHVTAEKTLVKTEIDAVIRFVTVVSEDYDEFGNCTVTVSVPIFGVTNSVAQIAFPPVDKQNFPSPTKNIAAQGNYTGLVIDCGDLELNPVLSPEIRNENRTIYAYDKLDRDKVIANGVVGYVDSAENVKLVNASGKNSFAQVGKKVFAAENDSRVGNNPLVVKISELSADGSCPVISTADADKILAENQISHFLDDGAVVFQSNRIRGMRM